jgi:hypothetical protein
MWKQIDQDQQRTISFTATDEENAQKMRENVTGAPNVELDVDSSVLKSEFGYTVVIVFLLKISLSEKERDLAERENCQRSWFRYGGGSVLPVFVIQFISLSRWVFSLNPVRTLLLWVRERRILFLLIEHEMKMH